MFTEECINTFLENQEQLFPQPVAESYEAAEAFLEDCMLMWMECQMKSWKKQAKFLHCQMENI